MEHCVNINDKKVIDLANEMGIPLPLVAIKIALWQDFKGINPATNEYDFPTKDDLDNYDTTTNADVIGSRLTILESTYEEMNNNKDRKKFSDITDKYANMNDNQDSESSKVIALGNFADKFSQVFFESINNLFAQGKSLEAIQNDIGDSTRLTYRQNIIKTMSDSIETIMQEMAEVNPNRINHNLDANGNLDTSYLPKFDNDFAKEWYAQNMYDALFKELNAAIMTMTNGDSKTKTSTDFVIKTQQKAAINYRSGEIQGGVRGMIDVLIYDKVTHNVCIIDVKAGLTQKEKNTRSHQLQLGGYAKAIENLNIDSNKITTRIISISPFSSLNSKNANGEYLTTEELEEKLKSDPTLRNGVVVGSVVYLNPQNTLPSDLKFHTTMYSSNPEENKAMLETIKGKDNLFDGLILKIKAQIDKIKNSKITNVLAKTLSELQEELENAEGMQRLDKFIYGTEKILGLVADSNYNTKNHSINGKIYTDEKLYKEDLNKMVDFDIDAVSVKNLSDYIAYNANVRFTKSDDEARRQQLLRVAFVKIREHLEDHHSFINDLHTMMKEYKNNFGAIENAENDPTKTIERLNNISNLYNNILTTSNLAEDVLIDTLLQSGGEDLQATVQAKIKSLEHKIKQANRRIAEADAKLVKFPDNPTALKSKLNWSNAIVEYNNELTRLKADSKGKHFVKSEIKQAGRDLTFWETFWFSGRDNGSWGLQLLINGLHDRFLKMQPMLLKMVDEGEKLMKKTGMWDKFSDSTLFSKYIKTYEIAEMQWEEFEDSGIKRPVLVKKKVKVMRNNLNPAKYNEAIERTVDSIDRMLKTGINKDTQREIANVIKRLNMYIKKGNTAASAITNLETFKNHVDTLENPQEALEKYINYTQRLFSSNLLLKQENFELELNEYNKYKDKLARFKNVDEAHAAFIQAINSVSENGILKGNYLSAYSELWQFNDENVDFQDVSFINDNVKDDMYDFFEKYMKKGLENYNNDVVNRHFNTPFGYTLISKEKDVSQYALEGDIKGVKNKAWSRLVGSITDNASQDEDSGTLQNRLENVKGNVVSNSNNREIPIMNMTPMDADDISDNLMQSVMNFYKESERNKALNEQLPIFIQARHVMGKPKKRDGLGRRVVNMLNTNLMGIKQTDESTDTDYQSELLNNFIDSNFFNQNKGGSIKVGNIRFDKVINALSGLMNFSTLGGTPGLSQVSNFAQASYTTWTEALSGETYTTADRRAGMKSADKALRSIVTDLCSTNVVAKYRSLNLMRELDVMSGDVYNDIGNKIADNKALAMAKSLKFFFQTLGDAYPQTIQYFTMLHSIKLKVNGEETNILDFLKLNEKDEDFKSLYEILDEIVLDQNIEILNDDYTGDSKVTKEALSEYIRFKAKQLQSINRRSNGVYGSMLKIDEPRVRKLWYGKMLETFKKFIATGFKRRFGNEEAVIEQRKMVKGFHNDLWSTIFNDYNKLVTNLPKTMVGGFDVIFRTDKAVDKYSHLYSEDEIRNFKRSITEQLALMTLGLMSSIFFAGGDDDENKEYKRTLYTIGYLLKKLQSDIAFFNMFSLGSMLEYKPLQPKNKREWELNMIDSGLDDMLRLQESPFPVIRFTNNLINLADVGKMFEKVEKTNKYGTTEKGENVWFNEFAKRANLGYNPKLIDRKWNPYQKLFFLYKNE